MWVATKAIWTKTVKAPQLLDRFKKEKKFRGGRGAAGSMQMGGDESTDLH